MRSRLLLALCVLPFLGCPDSPKPTPGVVRAEVSIPVPDFTLTERNGQSVKNTDLQGKVWVASFVFTRCTGPCPQVTATMGRLQSELNLTAEPNLRLVTFTVDPERDTPDELKDYATKFRADPKQWLFLTGPEEKIHHLLKDGFKVSAQRSKTPKPGEEFDHSSRLVVVDKAGNIRGFFDGMRAEKSHDPDGDFTANLTALKSLVGVLLKE
ncbi:SCO family protein [Zavarzinella formosa]|uniref:SCO family protein n=1 Tax=Zavarzinella formosa TaxID=360055 RepID=UPI00069908D8|nr:SCO family protein [Zavarzinella formosa]